MHWCEGILWKACCGKYTAAQLRQIMSDVAHALSDDPKTGNPRLRRTT
jgi:hypothetical protein